MKDEDIILARDMRNEGITYEKISSVLFYSPSTIRRYVQGERGTHIVDPPPLGKSKQNISPEMKEEIVNLRKADFSLKEIAYKLKISIPAIVNNLPSELKRKNRPAFTKHEVSLINTLYEEGWSTKEIAKELKANQRMVQYVLAGSTFSKSTLDK